MSRGRLHAFLPDLEHFVVSRNANTDRRKVLLALTCLKNEAHHSLKPLVSLGIQWEELRPKLLSFFVD